MSRNFSNVAVDADFGIIIHSGAEGAESDDTDRYLMVSNFTIENKGIE